MKAYKGFNNDMTCRNFKYEAGKTYEFDGEVKLCSAGFHACKNPFECFSFYAPANSEYHEVELEDVSPERGEGTKVVAKKITIGAKINLFNLVQAGVKYIKSKINWDGAKETTTGYYSAATNTGDCSAAEVSGKDSIAVVTGKDSKARGALGCWLVLTERNDKYDVVEVRAVKVDGENVKPDTWYKLENGEIKET